MTVKTGNIYFLLGSVFCFNKIRSNFIFKNKQYGSHTYRLKTGCVDDFSIKILNNISSVTGKASFAFFCVASFSRLCPFISIKLLISQINRMVYKM